MYKICNVGIYLFFNEKIMFIKNIMIHLMYDIYRKEIYLTINLRIVTR